MKITRWGGAGAVLGLAVGALALAAPAQAQDEVTFSEPGPVDLSGSMPDTHPNVGERVTLGSVELGPGEWTFTSTVRLVAEDDTKRSQGCGLYADDVQIGGAGGSSSLWTDFDGGREVLLSLRHHPFDPDVEEIVLTVDDSATVELRCFIDGSKDHDPETRRAEAGLRATDIEITAVSTPDPEPTTKPTGEPELECVDVNTADAETLTLLRHVDAERAQQILDLRPFTSVDDLDRVDGLAAGGPRLAELVAGGNGFLPLCEITAGEGGEDDDEGLPVTGLSTGMLAAGGALLLAIGGGAYLVARRRRMSFTA